MLKDTCLDQIQIHKKKYGIKNSFYLNCSDIHIIQNKYNILNKILYNIVLKKNI